VSKKIFEALGVLVMVVLPFAVFPILLDFLGALLLPAFLAFIACFFIGIYLGFLVNLVSVLLREEILMIDSEKLFLIGFLIALLFFLWAMPEGISVF